jgi:2'-5' RNA ligase
MIRKENNTVSSVEEILRLFIALELPLTIREEIAAFRSALQVRDMKLKWEKVSNMHITIKFLGNTGKSALETIVNALSTCAAAHQEIDGQLAELGFFPNVNRPRIVWIAPDQNSARRITGIRDQMESLLQQSGFHREKRHFHPHITIARIKECSAPPIHFAARFQSSFPEIPFTMNRLILYRSTLTPEGAIYEPLRIFLLHTQNTG